MNANSVKQEMREILEWVENPHNSISLNENPTQEINQILKCDIDLNKCSLLAFELSMMKTWLSNNYLAGIAKNEDELVHACKLCNFVDYWYYSFRIFVHVADHPGGKCRISRSDPHSNFFVALAFNRHEQALWIGGRAYLGDTPERFSVTKDEVWTLREVSEWESLGGDVHGWRSIVARLRRLIPGQRELECSAVQLDDDPNFPYWQEEPLCGYMLRLWLVMSGQIRPNDVPAGHPGCGVYEGLFTNWDKFEALEQSLIDACDYHVLRSSDDGDDDYDIPEFSLRPYRVIPFEILAYRNVRRKMGLKTPWPAHPLLDSPFVRNLPDELPPSDDPLLGDVLAAVRRVFPEV